MVLFLSESDVLSTFTMGDCIRVVDEAFHTYARGQSLLLPRMSHTLPGDAGAFRILSAALPQSHYFGLKTLTGVPGRRCAGETYFTILLFESETGALRAVISANHLTGLRTGAATAVAAKYLGRENASVIGIFGAGAQAKYQIQALCAVRDIRLVKIYTPHHDRASAFARDIRTDMGVDACAVLSPREAVSGCSLIVAATTAQEPVFDGHWVEPGTHISGVGSNAPKKQELDAVCFQRSRLVVDLKAQALDEAGDLRSALESHAIERDHVYAELGEIVAGVKQGRADEEQITLFKSVGIAIEDIASAIFVYQLALELGVGTELKSYQEIHKVVEQ